MFVVNELKRYTNEKQKKNADSKQAFSLCSSPKKKKGGNVKGESVFNESG
jgi:hypothetical protein